MLIQSSVENPPENPFLEATLEHDLLIALGKEKQRRADMNGIIQIVSGLVLGGAGFYQISVHPIQGICALFLAGFLIMIGFEKKLAERYREMRH